MSTVIDGAAEGGAERQGIQVIARAAAVLRALESEADGLSLSDIAARVGLARSTVQRIVGALAEEQIVISATPRARVKLGPLIVRLAAAANVDVTALARPIMQALSQEVRETVDLSVMSGRHAVFIAQVPGPQRLAAVSAIGESFPLHCTANGKALLARLPEERRAKLLRGPLVSHTLNTITETGELVSQLDEIRRTRIAWDHEEHSEGISAVGTSFADAMGRDYALSIPAPTSRLERRRAVLTETILRAADRLASLFRVTPTQSQAFSGELDTGSPPGKCSDSSV